MASEKPSAAARQPNRFDRAALLSFAGLAACLVWGYWATFGVLSDRWAQDPQYSHGWLVPFFAGVVLWMRRERFPGTSSAARMWGLGLLVVGGALRVASAVFYYQTLDFLSLIPMVAGVTLLCFGWPALRWSLPAILFLGFMFPLPYTIENALREPLRGAGTVASTYVMQTVGLPAYREGYTIVTDRGKIGVAEACSGLRMMMIFFALSTAVAMLSQRVWWEKLLIVVSAVPIALIANIARITVTGILHETVSGEVADVVFHDLAGWLMMPFGLALLGVELWLLSRLIIVEQEIPLAPMGMPVLGPRARPRA
jgi:exosortase